MKKLTYPAAKKLINPIYQAAKNGEYDTREKFMAVLEANPEIASQGYNAFGKVFFWNTASAHLYGYSEHAAVNKDLIELILPKELHPFAHAMVQTARKSGYFPDPAPCDLLRNNGKFITVYSGHLVFQWDEGTEPEFYCIDVALDPE